MHEIPCQILHRCNGEIPCALNFGKRLAIETKGRKSELPKMAHCDRLNYIQ